jgi:hypothetical protein
VGGRVGEFDFASSAWKCNRNGKDEKRVCVGFLHGTYCSGYHGRVWNNSDLD